MLHHRWLVAGQWVVRMEEAAPLATRKNCEAHPSDMNGALTSGNTTVEDHIEEHLGMEAARSMSPAPRKQKLF